MIRHRRWTAQCTLLAMGLAVLACSLPMLGLKRVAISGSSMEPTFADGDILHFEPIDPADLQRGDIAIYIREDRQFVTRVIGLPGERVEVAGGQVLIDGEPLEEPYAPTVPEYEMPLVRLGDDEFFVLGDNRNASLDSHIFGPLPAETLTHRWVP